MKIVVTSGSKYTDIDILGCVVAYTELLKSEGKEAEAVISDVLNKSVTEEIKSWKPEFCTKFNGADAFVIVDTSYPKYFSEFVEENKIIELYDHHFGYEEYFEDLLGDNSHIEAVGACATQIWEQFRERSEKQITLISARLLYAAIVSNTLNFRAQLTNKRDITAAEELKKIVDLPENWVSKYFSDQDKLVYDNPVQETINDTHHEQLAGFDDDVIIGQLELWNSKKFLNKHIDDVEKALKSFNKENWFLTSPSIEEGINYIYTKQDRIKKLLSNTIDVIFDGNLGKTKKLWLRKEIIRDFNN